MPMEGQNDQTTLAPPTDGQDCGVATEFGLLRGRSETLGGRKEVS